jgi:predicted transposase YbfD/YdcC
VDEKSNEIPAVRDLLKAFASLASAVVTIDAMHTQHDTAQVILGRGAGYVMTVKATMPALYRQLKKLPWPAVPAVSSAGTGHGRRARRTIKAVLAPAWVEFEGAAQVAQLRRTVTKNGKKTVEVVYLITGDRDAGPATLAAWVRGHREIEPLPEPFQAAGRRIVEAVPGQAGEPVGAAVLDRDQAGKTAFAGEQHHVIGAGGTDWDDAAPDHGAGVLRRYRADGQTAHGRVDAISADDQVVFAGGPVGEGHRYLGAVLDQAGECHAE